MIEKDFLKWCDKNGINNTADDIAPWRECWESAVKSEQKTITALQSELKEAKAENERLRGTLEEIKEVSHGWTDSNLVSIFVTARKALSTNGGK